MLKNNILSKDDFQLLKSVLSTVNEFNSLHLFFKNSSFLCVKKETHFKMIDQEWCYSWIVFLWIDDRSWQSQEMFESFSSFSIVINLEWFTLNSSSLKFLFFLFYILERITLSWADNEIHLFMMSTTNLLILFCVQIEVRRVKRFQFDAIQTMLECCVSRKVDRAEFSPTQQHFS